MLTIRTKSGAEYLVNQSTRYVKRVGPHSPGINYDDAPDDEWHEYAAIDWGTDEPGTQVTFYLANGVTRATTPVVEFIEDGLD